MKINNLNQELPMDDQLNPRLLAIGGVKQI